MYSIFTNIYLRRGDELRLLHRAAEKAIWPDALLGIGGKVEPNEDLFEAARREFREEAGAQILDLSLAGTVTWLDDSNHNGINYIFTATKYEGTLLDKCDEGTFEWVDIKDALVSPKTAVHQLKYLPYLMNDQHFSQYLIFHGEFSDGNIIKDYNSVGYSNHRLSKDLSEIRLNITNEEKFSFLREILNPHDVQIVRSPNGISVDVKVHSADNRLNLLLIKGIKRSVEDEGVVFNPKNAIGFYGDKITESTNIVLEYAVTTNSSSKTTYIPARLTKKPNFNSKIKDNFFWSFIQFNVGNQWIYYVDLKPKEKQAVFSLLAQAIMNT